MHLLKEISYDWVYYRKLLKEEKKEYNANLKTRNVWLGGAYICFKTSSKQAIKNVKNVLADSVDVITCTDHIQHSKKKKEDYEVMVHVEFKEQFPINHMELKNTVVVINELVEQFSLISSRKVILETYVLNLDDASYNASSLEKVVLISKSDLNWKVVPLAA
ncbi:hypothetical protein SAMN04487919_13017 [Bacillus sp. ok061]|uniref:hypothetical protein n=1 Tax=Bacillus sp. ok061 TaxID=1761766 RepID=UPI00089EAD50|nr:hypothetical protein [Bacillus sp. ok061]SEG81090.1 hypothetical protein SAMN04487919_13017 [Bacillus sp. ok061]